MSAVNMRLLQATSVYARLVCLADFGAHIPITSPSIEFVFIFSTPELLHGGPANAYPCVIFFRTSTMCIRLVALVCCSIFVCNSAVVELGVSTARKNKSFFYILF